MKYEFGKKIIIARATRNINKAEHQKVKIAILLDRKTEPLYRDEEWYNIVTKEGDKGRILFLPNGHTVTITDKGEQALWQAFEDPFEYDNYLSSLHIERGIRIAMNHGAISKLKVERGFAIATELKKAANVA